MGRVTKKGMYKISHCSVWAFSQRQSVDFYAVRRTGAETAHLIAGVLIFGRLLAEDGAYTIGESTIIAIHEEKPVFRFVHKLLPAAQTDDRQFLRQ